MKIDIKNLTNSPYKIGNKMLPARGELKGVDVTQSELQMYRTIGYFKITESSQKEIKKHIDVLRDEYKELSGDEPDKRWSVSRLKSEIEKIL